MDIKLYHNNSLSNVVDKSLTLVSTSSSAKFLEPYDEYSPVIRYRGKTNFDDVNYVGIEQSGSGGFTRYYFLEGVTYKSPNIATLNCRLDVLMTYKTFIQGLSCYLERCADPSFGSKFLVDNRPVFPMRQTERLLFRDDNNKVEGFIRPGESEESQRARGFYVLLTLQAEPGFHGYGDPSQY